MYKGEFLEIIPMSSYRLYNVQGRGQLKRIDKFNNSNSVPELKRELELKYLEQNELKWELKDFELNRNWN